MAPQLGNKPAGLHSFVERSLVVCSIGPGRCKPKLIRLIPTIQRFSALHPYLPCYVSGPDISGPNHASSCSKPGKMVTRQLMPEQAE